MSEREEFEHFRFMFESDYDYKPRAWHAWQHQQKRIDAIEQQRDQLLEALKDITSTVGLAIEGSIQWDAHKNARKVIAEIEAKK